MRIARGYSTRREKERVKKRDGTRRVRKGGGPGTGGRARETDGAEKRSLPTASGDAPKTRWTCGAISAPFFSPSSSPSPSVCGFFSHAFVSSPILILRELHGVSGTRVENESTEPVKRGRGSEPGGRKLSRALLYSFATLLVCVKKMLRFFYFCFTFSFAKKYYVSFTHMKYFSCIYKSKIDEEMYLLPTSEQLLVIFQISTPIFVYQ